VVLLRIDGNEGQGLFGIREVAFGKDAVWRQLAEYAVAHGFSEAFGDVIFDHVP
jgi:hypothetical protein